MGSSGANQACGSRRMNENREADGNQKGAHMNRDFPEKLDRKVIYESDWISLYADRVRMPGGEIIESYHDCIILMSRFAWSYVMIAMKFC